MKRLLTKPRCKSSQEHGDWRLPLDYPEEVEHLKPLPLLTRFHLHVRYQQSQLVAAPGMLEQLVDNPPVVPIHGWPRLIRACIALFVLMPLSVVMVFALLVQIYHAAPAMSEPGFWLSVPVWYSLLGSAAFFALLISKVLEPALVYVYVLGHELTHALATLLCMGKIQAFNIDFDGGYVETDKDNLFIALSPYFVPLWMLVWMLVLWLADWIYPFDEFQPWFYAGFGFWWSFHLYWTLWVIPREQPDMLENGMLLSALITLLMNIVILLVVLACFEVITPAGYAADFMGCAMQIYDMLWDVVCWLKDLMEKGF